MRDLAPHVMRQRLLLEANYQRSPISRQDVIDYLKQLPRELNLKIYSEPVVFSPGGEGREINQGYDGFVALIDSGISIYVWESAKFLSAIIYTCKHFDQAKAIAFTKQYFSAQDMEHLAF